MKKRRAARKSSSLTMEAIKKKMQRTELSPDAQTIHTTLCGYIDEDMVNEIRSSLIEIFPDAMPLTWRIDASDIEAYQGSTVALFGEVANIAHRHGMKRLLVVIPQDTGARMFFSSLALTCALKVTLHESSEEADEILRDSA